MTGAQARDWIRAVFAIPIHHRDALAGCTIEGRVAEHFVPIIMERDQLRADLAAALRSVETLGADAQREAAEAERLRGELAEAEKWKTSADLWKKEWADNEADNEALRGRLAEISSISSTVTLKRHGCDPDALIESLCNTGDFDTIGAKEAAEMFSRIAVLAAPPATEPRREAVDTVIVYPPFRDGEATQAPMEAHKRGCERVTHPNSMHPCTCSRSGAVEPPPHDPALDKCTCGSIRMSVIHRTEFAGPNTEHHEFQLSIATTAAPASAPQWPPFPHVFVPGRLVTDMCGQVVGKGPDGDDIVCALAPAEHVLAPASAQGTTGLILSQGDFNDEVRRRLESLERSCVEVDNWIDMTEPELQELRGADEALGKRVDELTTVVQALNEGRRVRDWPIEPPQPAPVFIAGRDYEPAPGGTHAFRCLWLTTHSRHTWATRFGTAKDNPDNCSNDCSCIHPGCGGQLRSAAVHETEVSK